MVGIVIAICNRGKYFAETIKSLQSARIEGVNIYVVDDFSDEWMPSIPSGWVSLRKSRRMGINHSLMVGYEKAFHDGCEVVMSLDGDSIVRNDFLEVLLRLREVSGMMVSGFNIEGNGGIVLDSRGHHLVKTVCSSMNMMIDIGEYRKYVEPELKKAEGNYACDVISGDGIAISVPSVVQRDGMAKDFKRFSLPNVTLFGVDAHRPEGLLRAAEISCKDISFGAEKIITERLFWGREGYSDFCVNKLSDYIDTEYVLIIHDDGYVQDASAWRDSFLDWDYIGAPWLFLRDHATVGNGGFSLRSKRFLEAAKSLGIPSDKCHPEDAVLCRTYKNQLKRMGMKIAPQEVAERFSIEAYAGNRQQRTYSGQFGFHGYNVRSLPIPPLKRLLQT